MHPFPSRRALAAVLGLALVAACSDTPDSAAPTAPTRAASRAVAPGVAMRSYQFDAPATSPWNTDPAALRRELQSTDGRVFVSLKRPENEHALAHRGIRGTLLVGDVDRGVASLEALGATTLERWPAMGTILVQIAPDSARALLANPYVDFVDADHPHAIDPALRVAAVSATRTATVSPMGRSTALVPGGAALATTYNDPELDKSWSMGMLRAPDAWAYSTGATDKVMLMSRYGIQLGITDLPTIPSGNCMGAIGACNASDGLTQEANTTLGAWMALHNGYQAVGAAPGISGQNVYVWRMVPQGGTYWTSSTLADGLNSAVNLGVKTLLMEGWYWDYSDATLNSWIGYAWDHDVVMIDALSRDGSLLEYPATLSQVVGVSGVTSDSQFASATNPLNPSPCPASGWGSGKVQVAAPFDGWSTSSAPDGTGNFCGWNMAAAYAAGVSSLLRAQHTTWTNTQVRSQLLATATAAGDAAYYGSGIVNALTAVTRAPLSVTITGASTIKSAGTYTWTASASGGNGAYTYTWERSDDGGGYTVIGTGSSVSAYVDNSQATIDWRVTATCTGATGTTIKHVSILIP